MSEYSKLLPQPTADTQPYWDGLNGHKLRLQRCADCGRYRFIPLELCPSCHSAAAS